MMMQKNTSLLLSITFLAASLVCTPCLMAKQPSATNRGNDVLKSTPAGSQAMELADLPPDAHKKISRHLHEAAYAVNPYEIQTPTQKVKRSYRAGNRNQGIIAHFSGQGVQLGPRSEEKGSWQLGMCLSGYGYEGGLRPVETAQMDRIQARGRRVEIRREMLTEWYVNKDEGLEQGFTLARPPLDGSGGWLALELSCEGSLRPALSDEGSAIVFRNAQGEIVLHYSDLKAWDARGNTIPARLSLVPGTVQDRTSGIKIVVNDADAVYPLTIDPMVTAPKAKLTASDAAANDRFGRFRSHQQRHHRGGRLSGL